MSHRPRPAPCGRSPRARTRAGGEEPARRRAAGERPLVAADRRSINLRSVERRHPQLATVGARVTGTVRADRAGAPARFAAGRTSVRPRSVGADQQQPRWQRVRRLARRRIARSRRRSRLRTTAGPRARPSANASRCRRRRVRTPGAPEDRAADPRAVACRRSNASRARIRFDQAERRARPLARRFLSTARPARVDIRARKPCFLARRWLLGWNVRFTTSSSTAWSIVRGGLARGADQARHGLRHDRARATSQGYGCHGDRQPWPHHGTLSKRRPGSCYGPRACPASSLVHTCGQRVDVPSRWSNAPEHARRTVNGTQSDCNNRAVSRGPGGAVERPAGGVDSGRPTAARSAHRVGLVLDVLTRSCRSSTDSTTLVIQVPSTLARDRILTRYLPLITDALAELGEGDRSFDVVIGPGEHSSSDINRRRRR